VENKAALGGVIRMVELVSVAKFTFNTGGSLITTPDNPIDQMEFLINLGFSALRLFCIGIEGNPLTC
jgi:hypothetical protein